MKRYLILLVFALISATGAGQDKNMNYPEDGNTTLPYFLGNRSFIQGELKEESFQEYLHKTVKYPQDIEKYSMRGTEVVEFVVTTEGKLTAFRAVNSVCPQMDKEVIRAIKTTRGKWVPGTVNGKPADVKKEISVVFKDCSGKTYMKKVQKLAKRGNHCLYALNNPAKAIKFYNKAISLVPDDESLLAARSLCLYELGDIAGAEKDWERIKALRTRKNTVHFVETIAEQANDLTGYDELLQALK